MTSEVPSSASSQSSDPQQPLNDDVKVNSFFSPPENVERVKNEELRQRFLRLHPRSGIFHSSRAAVGPALAQRLFCLLFFLLLSSPRSRSFSLSLALESLDERWTLELRRFFLQLVFVFAGRIDGRSNRFCCASTRLGSGKRRLSRTRFLFPDSTTVREEHRSTTNHTCLSSLTIQTNNTNTGQRTSVSSSLSFPSFSLLFSLEQNPRQAAPRPRKVNEEDQLSFTCSSIRLDEKSSPPPPSSSSVRDQ